ncbi:MAG: helix-turn-helix transcriptional regulator [Oscillospiraceae bacterium]|nr:helix-turn-helix transcriptional regulator [Oscillospiraceae bacterium]
MKTLHQEKHDLFIYPRRDDLDFIPHRHNAVELVYIKQGTSTALCDARLYPLSAGDLFVSFPNRIHGYEHSQNCSAVVFVIPVVPYLAPVQSTLEQMLPVDPVLRRGSWEHTGVAQLLDMALADRRSTSAILQGYALLTTSKLLGLLTLTEATDSGDSALFTVLTYLNDHYTQPLSRSSIAAATGYNESYISHLFADQLHTTLTDYLTSLRMDDALHLLNSTSLPVSQIALSLGFGSIRSFNRQFLDRMGRSPAAYRAAAK